MIATTRTTKTNLRRPVERRLHENARCAGQSARGWDPSLSDLRRRGPVEHLTARRVLTFTAPTE